MCPATEERSSSDDENENYDNVMFTPEDEEVQNLVAIPGEFVFHRFGGNVDDLVGSSNDSESCSSGRSNSSNDGDVGGADDNSSDDSDEDDYDEKFSSSSNNASNAETADTTHSYSNSLLEDEEDEEEDNNGGGGAMTDNSDFETDEQYEDANLLLPNAKIEQIPNFSDLNNGTFKRWSF